MTKEKKRMLEEINDQLVEMDESTLKIVQVFLNTL